MILLWVSRVDETLAILMVPITCILGASSEASWKASDRGLFRDMKRWLAAPHYISVLPTVIHRAFRHEFSLVGSFLFLRLRIFSQTPIPQEEGIDLIRKTIHLFVSHGIWTMRPGVCDSPVPFYRYFIGRKWAQSCNVPIESVLENVKSSNCGILRSMCSI